MRDKELAKMNGVLTKDQIEFRAKILGKRAKYIKRPKVKPTPIEKETTRNEYMNHCMFWINEYETGRTTKERVISAATNLRLYCTQIIEETKPYEFYVPADCK